MEKTSVLLESAEFDRSAHLVYFLGFWFPLVKKILDVTNMTQWG
jgi:hypothetical protein